MSKAKLKRHGFRLDMTPMVDVGFLLLTFFMLTAKFKTDNSNLVITLPVADADTTKLPDVNIATISIGLSQVNANEVPDTLIYFGIANDKDRVQVFKQLNRTDPKTGAALDDAAIMKMPEVMLKKSEMDAAIKATRLQNPAMRYAINADKTLNYGYVDDIMRTMQKYGATRFNLVTATR
jgi:biopolymer transport protein ExbD